MLFDLVYIVNGVIKETIMHNQPENLCAWKRNKLLKTGNYKYGSLKIKPNK